MHYRSFVFLPMYSMYIIQEYKSTCTNVQKYLLARVIFGEIVCEKQLADFILAI